MFTLTHMISYICNTALLLYVLLSGSITQPQNHQAQPFLRLIDDAAWQGKTATEERAAPGRAGL